MNSCTRFQCVNWICWKHPRRRLFLHTLSSRFQCVNWICWKLDDFRVQQFVIRILASNALIGFVGNAAKANFSRLCLSARFQCVNWICWKQQKLRNVQVLQLLFARFQCVNWICWKPFWSGSSVRPKLLASNALIGFVGNGEVLEGFSPQLASLPMR